MSTRTGLTEARAAGQPVAEYRTSEPHGWWAGPGQELGVTHGGHVTAQDFTSDGRSYRISLLGFDQPDGATDPVYEPEPSDPDIAFERTLDETFGDHYSFRYGAGLRDRERFRVQSYSVFVSQASEVSPLTYGTDLYVVYEPDPRRAHPAAQGTLLWVRVIHRAPAGGRAVSYVDNIGGVHPFTATGGRTSILGEQVVNLEYVDGIERFPARPERFMAEVFLVRDSRTQDQAGRDVVHVLGGLKYGWHVTEIGPTPPD